jgi:hypothetical protein
VSRVQRHHRPVLRSRLPLVLLASGALAGCVALAGVSDFAVDSCFDGCPDGPTGADGPVGTDTSTGDVSVPVDSSPGVDAADAADATDAADAAPPPSPGKSIVTVAGTGVAVGKGAVVTLTAKDAAGNPIARVGSAVVFKTSGGTSVVSIGAVVDKGDGTYRATLTGVTEGTKLDVSATLDGAPLTTAPASLRVINPVTTNLTFSIDAANADRAGNFGGKNCVASGLLQWTDLTVSSFPGALTSFVDPCVATSGWAGNGTVESPFHLAFDGVDDHVNYGAVNSLAKQTVLAWIKKTGPGTPSATTGTGGLLNIVPVITKGTNEAETDTVDINYYLGIASGGQLASDYETSANHPLTGATVITSDVWTMIGMTLDVPAGTRVLYLNGASDATEVPTLAPSTGATARLTVGASRTSTGGTAGQGAFQGDIAVVLTYDRALTQAEVERNCHSFSSRFGMTTCPN